LLLQAAKRGADYSFGASSPLLCAPAGRSAHLLSCLGIASPGDLPSRLLRSTSPRLAA
jgi:hypothetical protein